MKKKLQDVLEYLLPQPKVKKIEITTNGTVIPQECLVNALKHEKVFVEISNYGEVANRRKVESFCAEKEIKYKILDIENWINSGDTAFRKRTPSQLEAQYISCVSSYYCKTLFGDKLFQCARSAGLFGLGICREQELYLTINPNTETKDLFDFIFSDINIGCNYCDSGTEMGYKIPVAEQL